ncbi:MAG: aldo/keto reductase [Candidatus Dormibacteraceae bacterium]
MPDLETVKLGATGLEVGRLCLGTMIFGGPTVDEPGSLAVLDAAEELGLDFLDVADVYPVPPGPETWGRSEEIVGRWLRGATGRRERWVVATKFAARVGPGANHAGGSRKHVIEACEASLRRLGIERIDLYWMHSPDLSTPLEETLEALDRLVQAGKILYAGASNYEAWRLALSLALAAERRTVRFVAAQPPMSLIDRRAERELLPLCRAAGIAFVPYNPLAAGMLTGKYRRGEDPPAESRFSLGDYGRSYQGRYWSGPAFDVVEKVVAISAREGMSPPQVALAWLLGREGMTAPIVGASRPEQLRDDLGALGKRLSPEAVAELEEASAPFA